MSLNIAVSAVVVGCVGHGCGVVVVGMLSVEIALIRVVVSVGGRRRLAVLILLLVLWCVAPTVGSDVTILATLRARCLFTLRRIVVVVVVRHIWVLLASGGIMTCICAVVGAEKLTAVPTIVGIVLLCVHSRRITALVIVVELLLIIAILLLIVIATLLLVVVVILFLRHFEGWRSRSYLKLGVAGVIRKELCPAELGADGVYDCSDKVRWTGKRTA